MLNLDTHILIHALRGSLTGKERRILSSDPWSISGIVLWEISKLVQLGRVEMDLADPEVVRALSKVHAWPLTFEICRGIHDPISEATLPTRSSPRGRLRSFQYATRETLELDPLPCWKHLTPEQRQKLVAALVSEIEEEAAARRKRTGVQPLGAEAILAQNPQSQPAKTKRSPAPAVHAATRAVAASCGTPTSGSSPPIGTPRRSCELDNATRPFPRVASLRLCPS
jgi:hypothetical protein